MEELNLSVQIGEELGAGPGVEKMPVDLIPEAPGARRPAEESTAATGGLGGGEQLAPTGDRSAAMPRVTAETSGSSAVNTGDAGAMPESGAARPVQPEEPAALPMASLKIQLRESVIIANRKDIMLNLAHRRIHNYTKEVARVRSLLDYY